MNADNQLLESYAHRGSESAFRELVERHINLVHSAAMRESGGNASLAEDITQAVFTELARRAPKLVSHPSLAGWLYTCVRHTSANVRRAENRRHRREQEAFTMNEMLNADPADKLWQQVRPVLDDVMHELNDEDRAAVVMRFFEGRSLKEVGQALGLTENAARMRVERSLEKLHGLLSRRGVKSTAATLAALVAAGAVLSAPASLAATVSTGALAAAALGTSTLFGLKEFMNLTKIKIAGAGAVIIAAAALTVWYQSHFKQSHVEPVIQAQAVASEPAAVVNPEPQKDATIAPPVSKAIDTNQMALQVVEAETGRPLANTKVLLAYLREDGRGKDIKQVTDAQGRLAVDGLATPFHFLNMFITADGHVPKVTTLGRSGALPPSYTMKMDRGIRIGGVVVDEAGQPISGAKIEFDYPGGNNLALQENIQFGPDATSLTDADGHWFCNMIPKDLDHILLKVTHPDHAEASATIKPDSTDANDTSITMAAGFTVAGTVQDTNGNAIAGAKVRTVRMNSEGEQSKKTDEGGAFAMKCITGGELILSVQAKGFAPETQTLTVTGPVAGLKFQLGLGRLLRGRILDEAGNPITNAFAETLREATRKFVWSSKTDSDGRFEWNSAPAQAIRYSFQAEGYNRGYAIVLEADGSEHTITLARKQPGKDIIQVSGTAVDDATGQPLAVFAVLQRKVQSDWAPPFGFIADGKDGQFTFTSPAAALTTNYQLETECKGYLPAVSGILHVADGNQKLEFRLQKSLRLASGVVLLPTGEPAANATVLLCTSQAGVTLEGAGRVAKGINTTTYSTKTDRNGKFALPAVYAPEGLIAIHEDGFAQLSLADCEANGGILLHAWGGVEGTLVLDGQPAANETIVAYAQECCYDENGRRFGFLTMDRETKTDAAGKFSFDKLPPGQCRIGRRKTAPGHELVRFNSHETTVVIKAGAVTQVALGGTGRPVIGSVIMPGANNAIDWTGVPVYLTTKLAIQPGPRPRRDDFALRQAYIDAMDGWIAALKSQKPYGAFCDGNGAFRLQSIPAGTYELKIVLHDPNRQESFPNPHFEPESEMGSLTREVVIPEMDGGQSSEPLDLGTLELTPRSETVASH